MADEASAESSASAALDSAEAKDYPKLVMLGVLHMAQYFPAAFTGVALPFIFRKEGLPIEMFWLLALPGIPRWLKWLIALVVDNYGSPRIGFRKTWIIPCTLIG
ncbi:MAG: MFS transporter, partial [Gammaproteobacteria bacterium]